MLSRLLMVLLITAGGCNNSRSEPKDIPGPTQNDSIQNKNLKLGFTTQNFSKIAPVSLESAKKMIDYAQKRGFNWLELRDPDAALSLQESQEIANYARRKKVEVGYAIQKGLLDEDFWPTFKKGLRNAAEFNGPRTFRALTGGQEFAVDTLKTGWNEVELRKIVNYADSAAAMARANDLNFVIENGTEPLYGKEGEYYGLADVFERTNDQVGLQFDTANPFSVSRTPSSPMSVLTFLEDHLGNLFYIHLKSADKGSPQPVLMDNPFAFENVFEILNQGKVFYVAIELQAVDNEKRAYANMEESIEFLQKKDLLKMFQL